MKQEFWFELSGRPKDPRLVNVFVDCPFCSREEFFTIDRELDEIAVSCQHAPDGVYETYVIKRFSREIQNRSDD